MRIVGAVGRLRPQPQTVPASISAKSSMKLSRPGGGLVLHGTEVPQQTHRRASIAVWLWPACHSAEAMTFFFVGPICMLHVTASRTLMASLPYPKAAKFRR